MFTVPHGNLGTVRGVQGSSLRGGHRVTIQPSHSGRDQSNQQGCGEMVQGVNALVVQD